MCSGSEVGSNLRLIDFVYHSTLGLRVIKKRSRFILAEDGGVCPFLLPRLETYLLPRLVTCDPVSPSYTGILGEI